MSIGRKNLRAGVRTLHADGAISSEMPSAEAGWTERTRMRRFVLSRSEDLTGVSGVGDVAEGVMFSDGTAVLRWTVPPAQSTVFYDSIGDVVQIHGHDGRTTVRWIDE